MLGVVAVDLMEKEISEKVQHDADSLETCIGQLSFCLEQASEYVDQVVVSPWQALPLVARRIM